MENTQNIHKLSIIMPVYNEEKTILQILNKIELIRLSDLADKPVTKEIIIVDDCSKDGSRQILKRLKTKKKYKILFHVKNGGKGKAIRTGLANATGDIIIVQDADLEYDPQDYQKLIKPILNGKYEVVYGSRYLSEEGNLKKNYHLTFKIHKMGNKLLSMVTSMLYLQSISDMETCYKMFTRKALSKIGKLKARRFDFEPEITSKFLKKGFKIKEIPIDYCSRDFKEGKKITWKDGLKALYYLIKYRVSD